jgi:hypothetical protein
MHESDAGRKLCPFIQEEKSEFSKHEPKNIRCRTTDCMAWECLSDSSFLGHCRLIKPDYFKRD